MFLCFTRVLQSTSAWLSRRSWTMLARPHLLATCSGLMEFCSIATHQSVSALVHITCLSAQDIVNNWYHVRHDSMLSAYSCKVNIWRLNVNVCIAMEAQSTTPLITIYWFRLTLSSKASLFLCLLSICLPSVSVSVNNSLISYKYSPWSKQGVYPSLYHFYTVN